MNEKQVMAIMMIAKKLNNFELLLRSKCEICGPILRGDNPSKYPECKRHSH